MITLRLVLVFEKELRDYEGLPTLSACNLFFFSFFFLAQKTRQRIIRAGVLACPHSSVLLRVVACCPFVVWLIDDFEER